MTVRKAAINQCNFFSVFASVELAIGAAITGEAANFIVDNYP